MEPELDLGPGPVLLRAAATYLPPPPQAKARLPKRFVPTLRSHSGQKRLCKGTSRLPDGETRRPPSGPSYAAHGLVRAGGSHKAGDPRRPPGQREQRTRRAGGWPNGDWRLVGSPGRDRIGCGLSTSPAPRGRKSEFLATPPPPGPPVRTCSAGGHLHPRGRRLRRWACILAVSGELRTELPALLSAA